MAREWDCPRFAPRPFIAARSRLPRMSPRIRKSILTFHIWIGLLVGLVLLVVALSGAALIFRGSLERVLDPQRFIVAPSSPRLPLDELAARARAAHPAAELESVRYFGDRTEPVLAYFSGPGCQDYVHLNPYTGAVLGIRQRYNEGFGWIEGLHKYLRLDPDTGEIVNASFAFGFVTLVLAGLALWWPATRRTLKAGLTLNPRLSGRPWLLNVHKTLGVYASLIILFSALTGIPIALASTRIVYYRLTGSKKELPIRAAANASLGFIGLEPIARRIDDLMPNARETYIALPKNGIVISYAIEAMAPHPNARSYVWLQADNGQVLRHTPYARARVGFRLYYSTVSLHTAVAGGWAMKIILLFAALTVPVLAFTGVASYARRRQAKSSRAPSDGMSAARNHHRDSVARSAPP
jgi:uncharacterized iron-regulated membrane protein